MDFSKELFEQQGHGELVFSQQLLLQKDAGYICIISAGS